MGCRMSRPGSGVETDYEWGSLRLAAQGCNHHFGLIRMHENVACLGSLARSDDAAAFHQVHQPTGFREAHPQLALQHRGRPELRGDHELCRLAEQVEVVADVAVDLP